MRRPILLAFCVLLAACSARDPVANGAENTAGLPPANEVAPDPTASPPTDAAATGDQPTLPEGANPPPAAGARIPALLHGRWGMSPQDCTSTRGDAKGLLTISGDELRFYESRAVPSGDVAADGNSVRGDFDFTGEGQTWKRFQLLRLQEKKLIRTESNPTASYTYAKCT